MKFSQYMVTALREHALDTIDHAEVAPPPWRDLLRAHAANSHAMAEIFDRIALYGDFELDARQEAELTAILTGVQRRPRRGPRS